MCSLRIHDLPEDDRPREKLEALGPAALTDAELIAILLRTGKQGASAIDLARALLQKFRSFENLSRCSAQEIATINGIGPAKAVQLMAAFTLASRLAKETIAKEVIETPEQIERLLGAEMRSLHKESLRVVLLDTRRHLLRIEEVSLGSLNESIAHPREVLRPAIIYSAHALILVHNHPSGDPSPSASDRKLTATIKQAAQLMQVLFDDHIILGAPQPDRSSYYSFKHSGYL